jgi:cellulose synthase operon protein YhjQ
LNLTRSELRGPMLNIAIVSAQGGTGRTMLTASLATLFAQHGVPVLALEFDPQNMLVSHLGSNRFSREGLITQYLHGGLWQEAALQNSDQVRFVPFGLAAPIELAEFEHMLDQQPHWLRQGLDCIDLPAHAVTFIDTAAMPSVYARQALATADFALVVLTAEPQSLALLPAMYSWLVDASYDLRGAYLVNKFDSSSALQNDMMLVLRDRLKTMLAPFPVHLDASVPLAFARLGAVFRQSPQSMAAHDLQGIAYWLLQLLGISAKEGVT